MEFRFTTQPGRSLEIPRGRGILKAKIKANFLGEGGVQNENLPWGGVYIGWFQKISIPIPRAASRNSARVGGLRRLEFRGHGGVHWTGIPNAYRGFQESNFQFGVVKSLQGKLVKNDLSKDDDSLLNMRHVQLNQHAGDTFQWSWSIKCLC